MDLIEASDERTKNGLKPLYDDINAMYELINDRFRELDVLCDQLQTRMEKGLIDKETFSNYINNLTDESDRIIEFMSARIPGWSPIKVLEEDVVF
jgi:RNAse (barnase) inhibitor barstar